MTATARSLFASPGGKGSPSSATRVWEVGKASWMYASVADAVAAINADPDPPSGTNRAVILVNPGKYESSTVTTIPAWTGVKGVSKGLVQFQNDSTNLFQVGDGGNVWFEDFLVEGSSNASLYAFNGANENAIHIRRVDMLNNGTAARQKFLIQEGADWTILTLEQCIVDYYGTSDFACRLTNSADARFVDTWIQDCFFDAFQLSDFGGSFDLRDLQDIRFWNCTIRGTNAPGAAAFFNTGIRHRKVGAGTPNVEITHCRMSGALALSGGVACFGDASTTITVDNSLARGAASSGTLTVRNSFITQ